MRLVPPPADHAGGRCMNRVTTTGLRGVGFQVDTAPLREVTASSPFRDETAAQLWACGCSKVWLSRGSIRSWASAPAAVDVGTELSGAGVCRTVRVASGPVHGARVVPTPINGA